MFFHLRLESSGKTESLWMVLPRPMSKPRSLHRGYKHTNLHIRESKLRLVTLSKMFAHIKQKDNFIAKGIQFYVGLKKNEEGNNLI